MFVSWSAVAPEKPGSPSDPGDPAYDFDAIDAAVELARAHGLDVLLTTLNAPRWAEGKNRPKSAPAGSWKPKPAAFADFNQAVAKRYSGSFGGLPRVRYYQALNEPNLATYLSPQWKGKKLVAADNYRELLNAASKAIESVDRSNVVVA